MCLFLPQIMPYYSSKDKFWGSGYFYYGNQLFDYKKLLDTNVLNAKTFYLNNFCRESTPLKPFYV